MNNGNAPEGMIPVEQFASQKGIAVEKVISMIKDGFYSGRIVEDEWYVQVNELTSTTNKSAKEHSLGYKSNYNTARTMSDILSVIGWIMVVVGVLGALILASQGYSFNVLAMLPGLAIAISGLFMVVAAQVTKATVDNADQTREIMNLLRKKI